MGEGGGGRGTGRGGGGGRRGKGQRIGDEGLVMEAEESVYAHLPCSF